MKLKKKITVAENVEKIVGGKDNYPKITYCWNQINRIAEEVWQKSGKLEFIGCDTNQNGVMFCVFQEMIKNKNNSYKRGQIYFVENDVVFQFQVNREPVVRRGEV